MKKLYNYGIILMMLVLGIAFGSMTATAMETEYGSTAWEAGNITDEYGDIILRYIRKDCPVQWEKNGMIWNGWVTVLYCPGLYVTGHVPEICFRITYEMNGIQYYDEPSEGTFAQINIDGGELFLKQKQELIDYRNGWLSIIDNSADYTDLVDKIHYAIIGGADLSCSIDMNGYRYYFTLDADSDNFANAWDIASEGEFYEMAEDVVQYGVNEAANWIIDSLLN